MSRKAMVVANWKMNTGPAEAAALAQDIVMGLPERRPRDVELVLCPPLVCLRSVLSVLEYERSSMLLGAQNVDWQAGGAFTGAVSARMLADSGAAYCIIGHSERRKHFREKDATIARKLQALLGEGLTPILCVGESARTRREGAAAAKQFVLRQLDAALAGLRESPEAVAGLKLVVAYEPIWSIGTGQTATPRAAQSMAKAIRQRLAATLGAPAAESARILYGGSLTSHSIAPFAAMPDIDGGLVGGASLDANEFCLLVASFRQAVQAKEAAAA